MAVIGIIFALAAAVWLVIVLRTGGLLAGCLLLLITGSCLGHPFFHVSVVTLDRLLWALIVGLWLLSHHLRGQGPRPATHIDVFVLLFIGLLTVSTFTHDWKIDGSQPASRLVFLYLMPFSLYCVARDLQLTSRQLRALCVTLSIFGVYLGATAVAEWRGWHSLVFPRYIVSDAFPEFFGRGRGPFLNPSANGIYLGAGLGCLWSLWSAALGTTRRLIVLGTFVIAVGGLATLTRCVWLGLGLSAMVMLVMHLPRRTSFGAALLIGCVGTVGLWSSWHHLVAFKRDKNVSVADMQQSAKLRPMLAVVAWEMFRDRPFTGVGLGHYQQHDDLYIAQRPVGFPLDPARPYHQHNVVLSLLTETGLLGTVPFLAMLLGWSRLAIRLWRSPTAPAESRQMGLVFVVVLTNYLANGMFQDVSIIPMVNLLLFFVAGILTACAHQVGLSPAISATQGSWLAEEFRWVRGRLRGLGS